MAANEYFNVLRAGVQSGYNAIATKDPNVLYFCTDTKKIYKGDIDFTESVVFAATKPQTPIVGKVYVLTDTKTVEVFNGTAWTVVSYPMATTIDADSNDTHVASAKAVFDFVGAEIAKIATSDKTVSAIANKSGSDATLTITKADNTTSDLTINGVVTTPTWNSTSRVLTLPVTGAQNPVIVDIGKDAFLDPAGNHHYETTTDELVLYLNVDDPSTSEPWEIRIPTQGMVPVYTGASTSTATVTVGGSTGLEISTAVKVDQHTGNAITIAQDTEEGGVTTTGGLRVDLSSYATQSDLTTLQGTLEDEIDAVDDKADANAAEIAAIYAAWGWDTF
jgi:hypothetical protein